MNARLAPMRLMGGLAFLLGYASALWGGGVALMYLLGFAVLSAQPTTTLGLPWEPPLIGLALAAAGGLIGCRGERRSTGVCLAGLILNLIGLALAAGLRWMA